MSASLPDKRAPTDAALLERARRGDQAAVDELCRRYRQPLVRFCERYLGDAEAAEDAAHEVLARVAVENRWPHVSFRAWVYRVARNHCLSEHRKRHHGDVPLGSKFAESRLPSPRTGPGTAVGRAERNAALRTAIGDMSPHLAELLSLRYFQDLGRAEIAAVLGISESAVKNRLVRAREELSRKLEDERLP